MIVIACFLLIVSALVGGVLLGMIKFFIPTVCFLFFIGGISTMQEELGWLPASVMAAIGLAIFTLSFCVSVQETMKEEKLKQCK